MRPRPVIVGQELLEHADEVSRCTVPTQRYFAIATPRSLALSTKKPGSELSVLELPGIEIGSRRIHVGGVTAHQLPRSGASVGDLDRERCAMCIRRSLQPPAR